LSSGDEDCGIFMRKKEAAWLLFRSEALPKILEERAKNSAVFKKASEAFKKDQKERARVLHAFTRDEERKQNWVHCPHCNTLWAGSDACSHVTCGVLEQKMQARNGQERGVVGCVREFDLNDAKKYTPALPPPLEVVAPPATSEGSSDSREAHGITCDKCSKMICGTRFRCLNCPRYNLCLACLATKGPNHGEKKRWPKKDHIFDVIHAPCNVSERSGHVHDDDADGDDELDLALQISASQHEQDDLTMALAASLTDVQSRAEISHGSLASKRRRRSRNS